MTVLAPVGRPLPEAFMKSLVPLNEYALSGLPNRSVVSVAPKTVPLLPLPLSSFALPLNG
jgi:hypothetical protein